MNRYKKSAFKITTACLIFTLSLSSLVFALERDDYAPLRQNAYRHGATAKWNEQTREVLVTPSPGVVHIINVQEVGGFIENGVSFVPRSVI